MKVRLAYRPGGSWLHRLHPLVKLAWLAYVTALVFLLSGPLTAALLLGAVILAGYTAGIRPGDLGALRLLIVTAFFLGILQVVFVRSGVLLIQAGPLAITTLGVERGVQVAARFISVLLVSYLFVLTTSPNELAYALMQAGLPYRYGFALVTALRMVPMFEREAQLVYQAQLARGVAYDRRNLKRFLVMARQLFLPLLVSALGKVDALAVSMEGRCFGKYPTRTYLAPLRPGPRDALAGGALGAAILIQILATYWR